MERKKFQSESLETLIHIDGKKKSLQEIADLYIEKMEEGFNLTVHEMASYLKCSYDYALRFQKHIRHIVIDQHVARKALVIHTKDTWAEEKYGHLYTNRKLFYRPDFVKYIVENSEVVTTYRRYMMSDFKPEVINHLDKHLETKSPREFIKEVLSYAHKHVIAKDDVEVIEPLDTFPDELHSGTSLFQEGFRLDPHDPESVITWTHKRYIYHLLRDHGVKKVRLGNTIRYRREDIQRAIFDSSELTGTAPIGCPKRDVIEFVEEVAMKVK